jgi:hypothetical protein
VSDRAWRTGRGEQMDLNKDSSTCSAHPRCARSDSRREKVVFIKVQLHTVQPARASLVHIFEEDFPGDVVCASTTFFIALLSPIMNMSSLVKGEVPPRL